MLSNKVVNVVAVDMLLAVTSHAQGSEGLNAWCGQFNTSATCVATPMCSWTTSCKFVASTCPPKSGAATKAKAACGATASDPCPTACSIANAKQAAAMQREIVGLTAPITQNASAIMFKDPAQIVNTRIYIIKWHTCILPLTQAESTAESLVRYPNTAATDTMIASEFNALLGAEKSGVKSMSFAISIATIVITVLLIL